MIPWGQARGQAARKPAPPWIDVRGRRFPIMREAQARRVRRTCCLRVPRKQGLRRRPHARRRKLGFASAAVVTHTSLMRIVIAAVGRLKQGPERELAASYRKRAE